MVANLLTVLKLNMKDVFFGVIEVKWLHMKDLVTILQRETILMHM